MRKENITISGMIKEFSKRIPNKVCFSFPEFDEIYTYKEFEEKVSEAAKGLIKIGIQKGDNVGIWMASTPEWFILFFAILKIGGVAVPINTSFKKEEIQHALKQFDIKTLVMSNGYSGDYINTIENVIPEFKTGEKTYKDFPMLKNIISIGFNHSSCISYDKFIECGKEVSNDELEEMENKVLSDDECIILPTSGTTGISKGVILIHSALLKNGYDIGERLKLDKSDNLLIQVPMFHCFGVTLSMLSALTHLSTITVVSRFKSDLVLKTIEAEKITCINGVPTMFERILNDSNFSKTNVSSIKKGIMAGSNCLPDFIQDVVRKMNMTIVSVYGLTEASPGCTMSSVDDDEYTRTFTVGKSLPGIECKIINPKTGEEVDIGVPGEFVVKGYNVMKGYYNMPEETEVAIGKDGWLHTGDLAVKNDDGTYTITGRIKDVIIRGGENIYPKEIEMLLNKCPGVENSVVFGVDDPIYQQEIMACVTVNCDVNESDIKSFLQGKCARYKIPKYVKIVKEFEKNAAGKVLVYKMKQLYGIN